MYAYLSANLLVQSEVNFLGRLSHPNLIKLLGYCRADRELLLIYEFMQKGSLENHLFGSKSLKHNELYYCPYVQGMFCECNSNIEVHLVHHTSFIYAGWLALQPLPWDIRLKIAIGAA